MNSSYINLGLIGGHAKLQECFFDRWIFYLYWHHSYFGFRNAIPCTVLHCKVSSFAAPPSLFSRLTAHNANNFWLNKFPIRISTINNRTDIRLSGLTKVVLYLMSLLHMIFILDLDNMWKYIKQKKEPFLKIGMIAIWSDITGADEYFPIFCQPKVWELSCPIFLLFWSQELNPPVTLKSLFKGRTRANSELKMKSFATDRYHHRH